MKSRILGLLAAGLLAGPMVAEATVTYTFEFSNMVGGINGPPGADFTIALKYSDFVTTTGMQPLGVSLPTTLGYDVLNAGTNSCGFWAFSNSGGVIKDCGTTFSMTTFVFSTNPPRSGYFTSTGSYSGLVEGNASHSFLGDALLTITSDAPEPGTLALLGLGLAGLGLSRRRKAH